jgi:hypothetical protein
MAERRCRTLWSCEPPVGSFPLYDGWNIDATTESRPWNTDGTKRWWPDEDAGYSPRLLRVDIAR